MSLWDDLDAESRKPGPTMTITKAQYGALLAADSQGDERLRAIVKRTAAMGSCSQTHHEHLARDARDARAAEEEPSVNPDPLTLPETAGDYPPERSTAFLVGIIFGLLIAAVVLVMVGK